MLQTVFHAGLFCWLPQLTFTENADELVVEPAEPADSERYDQSNQGRTHQNPVPQRSSANTRTANPTTVGLYLCTALYHMLITGRFKVGAQDGCCANPHASSGLLQVWVSASPYRPPESRLKPTFRPRRGLAKKWRRCPPSGPVLLVLVLFKGHAQRWRRLCDGFGLAAAFQALHALQAVPRTAASFVFRGIAEGRVAQASLAIETGRRRIVTGLLAFDGGANHW